MEYLTSLLGRLSGLATAILATVAAVGAAFLIGRSKGKDAARQAAAVEKAKEDAAGLQETIDAAKERNDVEIETASRPDGAAAERLRNEWSRD